MKEYIYKNTVISLGYCILAMCLYARICSAEGCWYTTDNEIKCFDTFQANISRNTYSVVLSNFQKPVVISNTTFSRPLWNNITSLSIACGTPKDPSGHLLVKAFVFSGLHIWVYLKLHCQNLILEKSAFYGLNNLAVLDLSRSVNLSPRDVLSNLNIEHLGNLKQLLLVQTGIHAKVMFDMADEFWNFIGKSRIVLLDASGTNIRNFNVTSYYKYCSKLKTFRVSGARLTTVHASMQHYLPCKQHRPLSEGAIIDTIKLYCPDFKDYFDDNMSFDLNSAFYIFKGNALSC